MSYILVNLENDECCGIFSSEDEIYMFLAGQSLKNGYTVHVEANRKQDRIFLTVTTTIPAIVELSGKTKIEEHYKVYVYKR
jgi:hypothetical protein